MKKENVLSLIRTLLMAGGAFLIGHNLFGSTVNESLLGEIIGSVMSIIALIWSFSDQTNNIERFQSTLMNLLKFGGGLLVASGLISSETLVNLSGILVVLIPYFYQMLSKKKSSKLSTGELEVKNLKGAKKYIAED